MEWISMKDRLPEEPGTYLVSCVSNGPYSVERIRLRLNGMGNVGGGQNIRNSPIGCRCQNQ